MAQKAEPEVEGVRRKGNMRRDESGEIDNLRRSSGGFFKETLSVTAPIPTQEAEINQNRDESVDGAQTEDDAS